MQEMWLQLAFKHVRGKGSVQPVEWGRAALLMPIRIPPKIFRLPLSQPTVGKPPASKTSMHFYVSLATLLTCPDAMQKPAV